MDAASRADARSRDADARARGDGRVAGVLGGALAVRLQGIDVARALAIIGMVAVHVGPTDGDGVASRLYSLPHGRASVLFVLVAGIGVTLLARSRRATVGSARVTLLWRAAILLPAGLALQLLDHGVNVILQSYALLFLVALVLLTVPDRWLLGSSALAYVAGPLVFWWGQAGAPELFDRANATLAQPLDEVAHRLVLSGSYPLITWLAPLLFGMWLGRRDLTQPRLQRRLVVWGTAIGAACVVLAESVTAFVAPPGYGEDSLWQLTLATPHSQMPLWLVGSTGAAAAVLGASLWLARRANRWLWPLVATGQLALTIYVLHVLSLHVAPDTLRATTIPGGLLEVAAMAGIAIVFATVWRSNARRGPLELVLRPPSRAATPH